MSHLEERLEADLKTIREFVWTLGNDVELAIRNAKKALLTQDEKLAYATVLGDQPINRNSRACDHMCHTFIARYLPGAGQLREMAATMRVNIILERIGDYAVTISRESLQLNKHLPRSFVMQIDALGDESLQILHDARSAFRDNNAEGAKALMHLANLIEHKMDAIYEDLFAADDGMAARTALTVFVVFNLLKRVADQAKNVCDQTVYAVRGVGKTPKIFNIVFLHGDNADAAHLAVAVGRKFFPATAAFSAAGRATGGNISPALKDFLIANGLPEEQLESQGLAALQHDLTQYDIVVSLEGAVKSYLPKLPFHTSALEWPLPEPGSVGDFPGLYRVLRDEIFSLASLLSGDQAA
ncbi:MAG: hypothetical protein EXR85_02150 [Xanthomonadales bacterium]|nr:hypothetical protein [Xanthomonadales bacterium]